MSKIRLKLKALIKTFGHLEFEAEIKDEAVITVPGERTIMRMGHDQARPADMIIQHLGLKEVDYIEAHREKVRAEPSPPGKEVSEMPLMWTCRSTTPILGMQQPSEKYNLGKLIFFKNIASYQ